MKTTLIISLLLAFSVGAFAKEKKRSVASSHTLEIKTFLGKSIVFASTEKASERFEMPDSEIVDAKAELVCKSLGYKHDRGQYSVKPLVDRGSRGPLRVHKLMDDGTYKLVEAVKMYSFNSVICEAPLEPSCELDHFNKTDVRFIEYARDDCP